MGNYATSVSAFCLMVTAPASAFAQAAQSERDQTKEVGLSDIVVTARKTTENNQKAPASITVVDSVALTGAGIKVPTDLEKLLPSASLRIEGAVAQTYIRGVGSNLDFPYTSPAAAITLNGIILPRYGTMGALFDLSSVQQIAGPQGTLYGGSAAGGAINLLTMKPASDFVGDLLVDGGNYGQAHIVANQNLRASDDLSVRLSADYNRHDGYQSHGLDAADRLEGRVSALFTPGSDLTALLFVSGYREKGAMGDHGIPNVRPLPDDPWKVPATSAAGNPVTALPRNDHIYIAGANIDWRIGDGTITYIPGYVRVKNNYDFWVNGPAGRDSAILSIRNDETQHSQELRWNQTFGRLKLSAGGFWLRNRTHYTYGIAVAVLPAELGYFVRIPVLGDFNQTRTGYSGFASATYAPTDEFRLTAGGRVSRDRLTAAGLGAAGPFTFRKSQSTVDWKAGAEYDVAPRIMLYGNIQTSYIPFGYNPDAGDPAEELKRSKLLAFSGGFKSRLLDNTLEINNEFYYYDYKNFQAFTVSQLTFLSTPALAQKSRIYGSELTLRWNVASDTKIDASLVAQNARYTRFAGPGYDYSGFRMASAPVLNVVVGLQQELDFGSSGRLTGRVSTQYNSGFWSSFLHQGTFQKAFTRTDLLLSYTPNAGSWSIQGYINNVENSAVFGGIGPTSPGQPGTGPLSSPRTFGLRLSIGWE